MLIRALKWLVALILALVLVIAVGGMLLSPKFQVTRTQQVKAPPDKVYALVVAPRAWAQWSAWNRRDPAMTIAYSGPDSGTGAAWDWKSTSQGNGGMRLTAAEPPLRVAYEIRFEGFSSVSTGELRFKAAGDGTEVTWRMDGDMGGNPLYRWFALFSDQMIGKDFSEGLANLKAVAERP
ncbi:SRPBCC family protein [uncultured Methylibium sp.]|uniref:SRPBCC family protein n=1 Tax=uncultured Methylibium sp. TaxID=381093 RepID=UPI0025F6FA1B|nr:SRPBCC family protein [uncultured Methylibium sp.]